MTEINTFIFMAYQLSELIPVAALALEVALAPKPPGAPIPPANAFTTEPFTFTKTELSELSIVN